MAQISNFPQTWHALRSHIAYLEGELHQRRMRVLVKTGQPIGQSAEEWAELEESYFQANVALSAMQEPARDASFWAACRGDVSSFAGSVVA